MNILNIKNLRERSLQKENERLLLAYPIKESRVDYIFKKFPTLCFRQDMANRVIDLIAIDSLFLKFAKGSLRDIQITPSRLPLTEHAAYLELKFLSRKNRKRPDISGRRSSRLNDIIVSIEDVKSTELKSPIEKIAQIYSESIYRVYYRTLTSTLPISHVTSFVDALILIDNILSKSIQEKILEIIKVDPDYLTIETLYNLTIHFRNESNCKDSNVEKTPDCWLLSLKGKRFVDLVSEA